MYTANLYYYQFESSLYHLDFPKGLLVSVEFASDVGDGSTLLIESQLSMAIPFTIIVESSAKSDLSHYFLSCGYGDKYTS